MYNVLDLFSGVGGFSLGLERTGLYRTIQFVEQDPFCRSIIQRHWPNVPLHRDVRNFNADQLTETVDVICGGFPCQDISHAGKGHGITGKRSGLWFEYFRLIKEIRPRGIIIENVAPLRSRGLVTILQNLWSVGYDTEWHCIPASAVGSPQGRDRIWIISKPVGAGSQRFLEASDISVFGSWGWRGQEDMQKLEPFRRGRCWPEPLVRSVDDGIPRRVDRLKAMGNSIVPQMATLIGYALVRQL